jgi:N-acetylneuraminic acid mutarotase
MAASKSLRRLAVFVLGLLAPAAFAQTAPNNWVWMGGSSTIPTCSNTGSCGTAGTYGTLTQFAAGNLPGSRQQAATWTDNHGNLWLFGGNGYDGSDTRGELNDLWEYNPTTKQWAWMGGSSAVPSCSGTSGTCGQSGVYGSLNTPGSGNIPGARYSAATWTDGTGNFWLFGGYGYDSAANFGPLNDLWEFNPSTMKWAWVSGSNLSPNIYGQNGQPGVYGTLGSPSPANVPGGRSGASTWIDTNGNLWLFGGIGEDSLAEFNLVINDLDDLWKFTPATGQWTWEGGSSEVYVDGNPGVYGTQGVAAPTNQPGARANATSWTDSSGNLWMLGGGGYNANNYFNTLNDLWEFSPETNEWTWEGGNLGSASPAQTNLGVYGTLGTFAPGNMPQGRINATGWTDSQGDFWLFGGAIFGAGFEDEGYLNDVWEFSPSKNQWAWMGVNIAACNLCAEPGVYGTLGTPSPANVPGGRIENARWTDANGHLWIFGGNGFDSSANYGYLNDLWEYQPVSGTPPTTITPTVTVTPSPSSITTAQALSVTVTVSGGGGKPTPTGSITLTSGIYTSQVTALSGGSIVITVAANSLEAAVDTLTAYYTPDAASASTYANANGSATEDVAATSQSTPFVGVTTVASGIWTTQALPVTVEVGGAGFLVPTGTVVLTAGSYTSSPVQITGGKQTSGWANFVVPEGSLPVGSGTIKAAYTPDAISSESLAVASGTASVLVSVQPANDLDWTWIGGDSILPGINSQYGVYGALGVAASTNWPGGRTAFSFWNADSNGNFWILGGEGNDSTHHGALMNDLWMFSPTSGEWTWVNGNNSAIPNNGGGNDAPASYGTLGAFATGNTPGGRDYASTGIDSSNHLWLFGGYGFDSVNQGAYLNDLWEYDTTKNQWAWISGSNTVAGQQNGQLGTYGTLLVSAAGDVPEAREEAASWVDNSGNFWIFGGYAQDDSVFNGCIDGLVNDLWKFTPSTSQWTWMGGANSAIVPNNCEPGATPPPGGTYGTSQTFAAGNFPGSRLGAVTWVDGSGNVWLFGGDGYDANDAFGLLNDLWEFNPSTNQWAWMSGSKLCAQNGVYGAVGVPASGNIPGARYFSQTWIDNNGNLWLLGGDGRDENGAIEYLNDFWEFNTTTKLWTWMGGSPALPPQFGLAWPGIYGTLGVPASANTSGGRATGAGWVDKSGFFWLFGGYGWDSVQQDGWMNDLWKFRPAENSVATTPTVTVTPSTAGITTAQGLTVTVTVSGGGANPTPTGSITLTSGTYTSGAVTLSSGAATISVPAGSLVTGTDTLTATYTPDSSSSTIYNSAVGTNTETVTAAATAPIVTVDPSPASITTAQALSVTVTLSGSPTPTGSVILTSGSYTSGAVTLTTGSATISILAGSLAKGTDTLTAAYTPDASSSSTYTSATGSNVVAVTAAAIAPTITVTPSPASITTSQALSVTVTVGGTPTPTGSVTLTSGSYTSAAVTLTGGTATINVPAGSLATGTDTLTATYTPDSSSSSIYNSAMASSTVTVTVASSGGGLGGWIWMNGSDMADQPTTYGTLGTPGPGNTPGGRYTAASWIDRNGNFWLLGGQGVLGGVDAGVPGYPNDFWQFNPTANQWTWMGGSNNTGINGQAGVYGTQGVPAAGNFPGSRYGSATWTDSKGNLWLFGGDASDINGNFSGLNDLWEFNISTNEWTWIAGSDVLVVNGPNGVYGTRGVPAPGNIPGGRISPMTWTDSKGNFWLFGGIGADSTFEDGAFGYLQDLWEFNPSTLEWTWMSGSTTSSATYGQPGVYGTLGSPSAANVPGGRALGSTWVDSSGNLWLFGGQGVFSLAQGASAGPVGDFNDLWEFTPSTMEWTWMGGNNPVNSQCTTSSCIGQSGTYGTLGTPAATNIPGGRNGASAWTDGSGNFWLFGGAGYDGAGTNSNLNDLWEFSPSTNKWTWTGGSSTAGNVNGQPGVYGVKGAPNPTNIPGGRWGASSWVDTGGHFWLFGGSGVDCANNIGDLNDLWEYQLGASTSQGAGNPLGMLVPTVTVSPSSSTITNTQGLTVTVTVSGSSCGTNPTPTGSVVLTSGSYTSAAVTLSSGSATINIPAGTLANGTYTLTASYTPDSASSSTYADATGSNTVTVTSTVLITPTVTVTPSPSSITTAQALSVTVSVGGGSSNPTPTGSVTLTSGTYTSGAVTLGGGSATINIPAGSLAASTDTLTASYTPDSSSSTTYNSATGSNTVTVTAATFQVTVGTTPAGLSFSVDGTNYSASQTLTWTVGASHTIATLTPQILAGTQESFSAWSDGGAESHSVTASSTTTTYTAAFTATAYQLTNAASPAADGTVTPASGTFYAPGTVVNLTATANTGFAFTNWTGNVASATSASTTVTMNAPQSVTANFGAGIVTAPVAVLTPATLTFSDVSGTTSAAQSATLTNSGNATLNITGITIAGTNPTDFAVSTGSNACGGTLAAGSSCLIYVTFTPASAATFSATLSVADNAAGSPQTASLSGTGTPVPTFTLSSPTAPQTVQAGGTAQFTITAAAQNGTFSNAVTLSASGLPAGAVATFAPPSVTPGISSANSTLSIQTGSTTASTAANHGSSWPLATSALAVIGLCLVPGRRRRRWITMAVLLIASLGALTSLTACGGGFALIAPSKSYTITVTGTSGTEVQATTVQLTVQ